jgi:hypothetical protein
MFQHLQSDRVLVVVDNSLYFLESSFVLSSCGFFQEDFQWVKEELARWYNYSVPALWKSHRVVEYE